MSEKETVIRATDLSKVYRLYSKPIYKFLDVFGFLRKDGAYTEHHALKRVNIEIRRGEKVAFIGRNGAGKSTLLKLITRVITPTSGQLYVGQGIHALLQIGSGFHQDFTGRQNVIGYLSHLGVTGEESKKYLRQIVDFAELEDFIDQPLKTYSTGMAARLMFATSTAIEPQLLVLDEILGVGDAYFAKKSFERIREMCEKNGTTVLLVSHDIYSAAQLCERMVWIDRGSILVDAETPTVMRAYEDSVREQEEIRLRLKTLGHARARGTEVRTERVILEIRTENNQAPPVEIWFSRVSLKIDDVAVASVSFGDDAFDDRRDARLQKDGCNWGDSRIVEGRLARAMRPFGSPFHKVACIFDLSSPGQLSDLKISFDVEFRSIASPVRLFASMVTTVDRLDLGELGGDSDRWVKCTLQPIAISVLSDDAAGGEGLSVRNWASWHAPVSGVSTRIVGDSLSLYWAGPAGPYLLTSPPVRFGECEDTVLTSVEIEVRSGRLGFGSLDAAGQWGKIYEFSPGPIQKCVLNFLSGVDGVLRLVLYSAQEATLDCKVRFLDRGESVGSDNVLVNTSGVHGSGDIRVEDMRILDQRGRSSMLIDVGASLRIEIDYRIYRQNLRERAQVLLAFQRNGVQDVLRVMSCDHAFDFSESEVGTIYIDFAPLPLAPGSYSIPVLIAAEGYFNSRQSLFFSINPQVYFLQSCAAEIEVTGFSQLYEGAGVVGDAEWEVRPGPKKTVDNQPKVHQY